MTTKKQVQANRKNAARSTGPRARAGKAASSKNAVTHGVLGKEIVLPTEDVEEFEDLSDGLHRSLAPAGMLEEQFVRMIVDEFWRLRRVYSIEASILTRNTFLEKATRAEGRAQAYTHTHTPPSEIEIALQEMNSGFESTTVITNERAHAQAESDAARSREMAASEATIISEAYLRDVNEHDALSKLSRYGAAIQRNLFRAIHQLERLQASRRGQWVPAPVAMDVDISVSEGERRAKVPAPRLSPKKGKTE